MPGAAMGLALLAAACTDDMPAPVAPAPRLAEAHLEVTALTAAPGSRLAVAVRLTGDDRAAGVDGSLRFDPARLRFAGQDTTAHIVMVNAAAADSGRVRWLAVDARGVPERVAVFAFDVLHAGYAAGLRLEMHRVVRTDLAAIPVAPVRGLVAATDLVAPVQARTLGLTDWYERLGARAGDDPGPQAVPGQYLLNLRYGDVNLSGSINVFDVAAVANLAVGNFPLLTDATRDYVIAGNVAPFNLPGLGEPGDDVAPGIEAGGGAIINVFDVVATANEAVGNDQPVAGELIPGRGPQPVARVVLSGIMDSSRTLYGDTIYELQGLVIVAGGATLTIEPGTRIEGDTASQGRLVVYRGGNILAVGTRLQPIVFSCNAAVKTPGCWAGVAIHGFALLNNGTVPAGVASSGVASAPFVGCPEKTFPMSPGIYGGCINQDTSGVLRYVRIEYAGGLPESGALPSLALLGVGSGTVIDSVQVHRSEGDGLFVSGGRVDLRSIVLTGNMQAGLSYADGWQGRMQFLMIQQPTGGGAAIRGVNVAAQPDALPRSQPQIYHVTISHASDATASPDIDFAFGSGGRLRNVVVQGSGGGGVNIDGAETCAGAVNGELHVEYSIFFAVHPDFAADADCIDEAAWVLAPLRGNRVVDPQLIAPGNIVTPDLRPVQGSPAETGFELPPSDGFFDLSALFVGAVPTANASRTSIPWYAGWTVGW